MHFCDDDFEVLLPTMEDVGSLFYPSSLAPVRKRELDKSLREAEDRLQDALANEAGTSPSLGATIYASRFAANALRTLRQNGAHKTRAPQRLLPLLPRSLLNPILMLKIISRMSFQVNYTVSLCYTCIVHM